MKFLFTIVALVIVVFLIQPAHAQLAPANQPVFAANDLVLVDAQVAMPTVLNETSLTVAPANISSHLKSYLFDNSGYNIIAAGKAGVKKGGFQNVEIVRLIKSISDTYQNNSLDTTGLLC